MTNRKTLTLKDGVKRKDRRGRRVGTVIGTDRTEGGLTCTVEMDTYNDGTKMIRSLRFTRSELGGPPEYTMYQYMASRMFDVPLGLVTEDQAKQAKKAYYTYIYGGE